jgi:anti-anti-sigma factor
VLTIEIQDSYAAAVVRCSGRIVHGDGADKLRQIVCSQTKKEIVIDLGQVRAIDAAGVGALATIQSWANHSGRTIRLLNPTWRVREVLKSTALDSLLEISQEYAQRTA